MSQTARALGRLSVEGILLAILGLAAMIAPEQTISPSTAPFSQRAYLDALKAAEAIAKAESKACANELRHKLSTGTKERTQVRKDTTDKMLWAIPKAMAS